MSLKETMTASRNNFVSQTTPDVKRKAPILTLLNTRYSTNVNMVISGVPRTQPTVATGDNGSPIPVPLEPNVSVTMISNVSLKVTMNVSRLN